MIQIFKKVNLKKIKDIISNNDHYPYERVYTYLVYHGICSIILTGILYLSRNLECVQWLPGRRVPYE